jgi:hypothetical protein
MKKFCGLQNIFAVAKIIELLISAFKLKIMHHVVKLLANTTII